MLLFLFLLFMCFCCLLSNFLSLMFSKVFWLLLEYFQQNKLKLFIVSSHSRELFNIRAHKTHSNVEKCKMKLRINIVRLILQLSPFLISNNKEPFLEFFCLFYELSSFKFSNPLNSIHFSNVCCTVNQ